MSTITDVYYGDDQWERQKFRYVEWKDRKTKFVNNFIPSENIVFPEESNVQPVLDITKDDVCWDTVCVNDNTKSVEDTVHFGVCGNISSGKSYFLERFENYINNTSNSHTIKREYPKLAKYIGRTKIFYEVPDGKILDRYYSGMNYIDGLTPTDVCFDTQIYFLSLRIKVNQAKKKFVGLIADDRTFFEDKLFSVLKHKQNFFTSDQYDIYKTFYSSLKEEVLPHKFFLYLKVCPEVSYNNLQKRIKDLESRGLDTKGEKMIKFEYLELLGKCYTIWAESMKAVLGEKFVVVEYNEYKPLEYMLKLINDNL